MLASPIEVATVRRLAEEFPRVVGIKDSTGDIAHMLRLIAAVRPVRPDFTFLTGWDPALVPMLLAGCDGGTNGTAGVAPEFTRQVYEAVRAGDLPRAFALQARLTDLFDVLFPGGEFPEGFRAGVARRGFRMGASRQPHSPAQVAAFAAVGDRVAAKLAELGIA